MIKPFPSRFFCEGEVAYNSRTRNGSFTFERLPNEKWRCVVQYADSCIVAARIQLDSWNLTELPSSIVEMCDKGAFKFSFATGAFLSFRAIDSQGATDLPNIGRLLLAIKNGTTDSRMHYAKAVHSLLLNSPATNDSSNCNAFETGSASKNPGRRIWASRRYNEWVKRFDGDQRNSGSSQGNYNDHFLGCRNYRKSFTSDHKTPHLADSLKLGRTFNGSQNKTRPLRSRPKEGIEKLRGVSFKGLRSYSTKSSLLQDHESDDNSLKLSESSESGSDVTDKCEKYIRDQRQVITEVDDTVMTKRFSHNAERNRSTRFTESTPRVSKSVLAKRLSWPLMGSPPKKNRRNSEEKESLLSTSSYRGGRLLSCSGFVNIGNSCYMNAVLQAVFCVKRFSSDLLKTYRILKCTLDKVSICRTICELLMERSIPNSIHAMENYKSLLKSIKEAVGAESNNFLGNGMQDAHEFLVTILQKMNVEIKQAKRVARRPPQSTNPIKHHFKHKTLERSTCMGCHKMVGSIQVLYDIGLPMPKNSAMESLQHIMNAVFKSEKRELICNCCGHKTCIVETSISTLPRILCIHLKRYSVMNGKSIKNANPVRVHKYLTLKNYVHENVLSIQRTACPTLSGTAREQASDPVTDYTWHVNAEENTIGLCKTSRNDFQTKSGEGRECSLPTQPACEKQGLLGGQPPVKDVCAFVAPTNSGKSELAQDFHKTEDSKRLNFTLVEEHSRILEESNDYQLDPPEESINGDRPYTYQLTSVVCHVGVTDVGHYTCYEADWESKSFNHYDDKHVRKIPEDNFFLEIQNNGYIFFYSHRNTCSENIQEQVH